MDKLDETVINFVQACYILAASIFIFSFAYICISKEHQVTLPICAIYLLEILTQSCQVALFHVPKEDTRALDALTSVSFSAHWIALGIFTSEYIRVATQVPLLRNKAEFGWFPALL